MKKTLLLILLTLTLQAESSCDGINLDRLKKLYAKETKGMLVSRGNHYDMKPMCKAISKEKLLVLTPYRGRIDNDEIEDNFYSLSLGITVIDSKNHEVLNYYFHKNIAESTAIALQRVEVDTRYSTLSEFTTFGIKIMVGHPTSHDIYSDEEYLYVYEFKSKNRPNMLLNGYILNYSSGLCDGYDLCKINYADVSVKIPNVKRNHDAIELTLKIFSTLRIPSIEETIELDSKEKVIYRTLIYSDGKYVEKEKRSFNELSISEVEEGAKNGKNYPEFLLANLLYKNYSQGAKTLTQLNDIAYYLQKNGHNKEAVLLLESLLDTYPKRTVAYYNLGDAYWDLGQKNKAKKMYEIYVKQMESRGKGKRVPEVVKGKLR